MVKSNFMHIEQLPFPRFKGTKHLKHYKVTQDLILEKWIVRKGTTVKLITGEDFGYVILPENCQDKRGFTIPKKVFRF